MNEKFVIHDDYSSLPINIGAPSFAISNNCKKPTVIKTIVFLTIKFFLYKSMGL